MTVPMRVLAIGAAAVMLPALAGCGGSGSAAKPSEAPVQKSTAPVASDQLDITLSGTVNSHITAFTGPPECTFDYNDLNKKFVYDVKFPITLGSEQGDFHVLINDADQAGGQYSIATENISVDGTDKGTLHWGGAFGSTGASGTVTVKPDHSATIDGAIKARTGPEFKGDGSILQIRGAWNCAHFTGSPAPAPS